MKSATLNSVVIFYHFLVVVVLCMCTVQAMIEPANLPAIPSAAGNGIVLLNNASMFWNTQNNLVHMSPVKYGVVKSLPRGENSKNAVDEEDIQNLAQLGVAPEEARKAREKFKKMNKNKQHSEKYSQEDGKMVENSGNDVEEDGNENGISNLFCPCACSNRRNRNGTDSAGTGKLCNKHEYNEAGNGNNDCDDTVGEDEAERDEFYETEENLRKHGFNGLQGTAPRRLRKGFLNFVTKKLPRQMNRRRKNWSTTYWRAKRRRG